MEVNMHTGKSVFFVVAIGVNMTVSLDANPLASSEPSIVLIQEDTGAGISALAIETGKSGTGKETDAGKGTIGKKSPFGADQPTAGDFSPNQPSPTASEPRRTDKMRGSEQPAGIGE